MIGKLLAKLVGDPNQKQLDQLQPIVEDINAHEDSMRGLMDDDLATITETYFRAMWRMATADILILKAEREMYREMYDVVIESLREQGDEGAPANFAGIDAGQELDRRFLKAGQEYLQKMRSAADGLDRDRDHLEVWRDEIFRDNANFAIYPKGATIEDLWHRGTRQLASSILGVFEFLVPDGSSFGVNEEIADQSLQIRNNISDLPTSATTNREWKSRFKIVVDDAGDFLDRIRFEQLELKLRQAKIDDRIESISHEIDADRESFSDFILPQAFAAVREASTRVLGMRHFDVQMIGGIVLHQGKIAEMRTGEGKTLVATLAAYLNALNGEPVHVVTVNDYLAKRDAEWMGPVYQFMGLSVGCLQQNNQSFVFDENYQEEGQTAEREDASAKFATVVGTHLRPSPKKDAYSCDILYATNNELGFDYLRDHMVSEPDERAQKRLAYGIVDEVDNILIDEARTPLLISGPSVDRHEGLDHSNANGFEYIYRWHGLLRNLYFAKFASAVKALKPEIDFEIDLKRKNASLTEHGSESVEVPLGVTSLYGQSVDGQEQSIAGQELPHLVENAIRSEHIFAENRDYVLRDSEIVLVDEFTGRLMEGRRFSDGMHQALEGKHLLIALQQSKSRRILAVLRSPGFLEGYEGFSSALDGFAKDPARYKSFENFLKVSQYETPQVTAMYTAILDYDRLDLREKVQGVASTYATITLQNYFRMYKKLSGMTGTAATEAEELSKIYGLDVVEIPTNQEDKRIDHQDLIYMTEAAKWKAAADRIQDLSNAGRPVLVGTTTIEKSQRIAKLLKKRNVNHRVLNAKEHESESHVIAQAGIPGAVTVATNMAGRGTDIILGGNPEAIGDTNSKQNGRKSRNGQASDPMADWQEKHDNVVDQGGLFVLGTERHESRRIDNQLRGRCARQGDPGETQFFLSVEDELVRRFGGDRIKGTLEMFKWEEDVPVENSVLVKSVENAQQKVEGINFEIRKQLVDYDDVANTQRDVIYELRNRIVDGGDFRGEISGYIKNALTKAVETFLEGDATVWDTEGFHREIRRFFPILEVLVSRDDLVGKTQQDIEKELHDYVDKVYAERELLFGGDNLRLIEHSVLLRVLDRHWVDHLTRMENMRQSIGLQAIGQRDPLVQYRTMSFQMFNEMNEEIRNEVARTIFHLAPNLPQPTSQLSRASSTPLKADALAAAQRIALAQAGQQTIMSSANAPRQGTSGQTVATVNAPTHTADGRRLSRRERRAIERKNKKKQRTKTAR